MISDSNGILQFYTNGCQIANASHEIMANGDSISPGHEHESYCDYGYPTSQGVLSLPWPERPNWYVLFHTMFNQVTSELLDFRYTTINMDTLSGAGAVVEKNQVLIESIRLADMLTSVRHANGRDWWIVMTRTLSNTHYRFLLTPEGIQGPFQQDFGALWDDIYYYGHAVFSPDGKKYVRANPSNGLRIADFDRCSGEFSNPINIPFLEPIDVCGVAISPNSRWLYLSTGFELWQYDLSAVDIATSAMLIGEFDGFQSPFNATFYQPMLAPDGKIYMTCTNGNDVLHVIHNPDLQGFACNFEQHGLFIPTYHAFMAPNFPHFRLGPLDGSPCDTLGLNNHPLANFRPDPLDTNYLSIRFWDISSYEPAEWLWDFGDGTAMSSDTNPVHTFPAPGFYTVCLTVANAYSTDSQCKVVEIKASGVGAPISEVLRVYPNPTTGQITVPNPENHLRHITVFDLAGKPVFQTDGQGEALDLSDLANGVYFLRVREVANGQVRMGKVVLAH